MQAPEEISIIGYIRSPSHPFIPPFVSDPGRERRNKGECGGMEVEVNERPGGKKKRGSEG